jgi:hypothetical protein
VNAFVNDYATEAGKITPTVQVTPNPTSATTAQSLSVTVTVSGGSGNPVPTGTVTLTGGVYTFPAVALSSGTATITIPSGTLQPGTYTFTATYAPDSNSLPTYLAATGTSATVSVAVANRLAPTVNIQIYGPITIEEYAYVAITMDAAGGYPEPTGNLTFSSGSTVFASNVRTGGVYNLQIQPGLLPLGTDTISVSYTPDSNSALYYTNATGTGTITVDPMQTPTITVTPASSTITTAQSLQLSVALGATPGFQPPNGTVNVTSISNSMLTASPLANGVGTIIIPAETLPAGTDTISVTFTDEDSIYNSVVGTTTVTVNAVPDFSLSASPSSVSTAQGGTATSTITVTPIDGFTGAITYTATGLPSGVTASFAAGTAANTEVVTFSATTSAQLGPTNVTITGTSDSLIRTTMVYTEITQEPSFGAPLGGGTANLSVTPGATTGNTVAINVQGSNGFSGTVALTCALTGLPPAGASDLPTCSLNPASLAISGTGTQTSTLTVNTTAPSKAENRMERLFWPATGGAALALMLFFLTPRRRRGWLAIFALVAIFAGVSACGGGGSGSGGGGGNGGGGSGNSGTTLGSYTITVTGASGGQTVTLDTVALTVQ